MAQTPMRACIGLQDDIRGLVHRDRWKHGQAVEHRVCQDTDLFDTDWFLHFKDSFQNNKKQNGIIPVDRHVTTSTSTATTGTWSRSGAGSTRKPGGCPGTSSGSPRRVRQVHHCQRSAEFADDEYVRGTRACPYHWEPTTKSAPSATPTPHRILVVHLDTLVSDVRDLMEAGGGGAWENFPTPYYFENSVSSSNQDLLRNIFDTDQVPGHPAVSAVQKLLVMKIIWVRRKSLSVMDSDCSNFGTRLPLESVGSVTSEQKWYKAKQFSKQPQKASCYPSNIKPRASFKKDIDAEFQFHVEVTSLCFRFNQLRCSVDNELFGLTVYINYHQAHTCDRI